MGLLLIKNGFVQSPDPIGKKDILIAGSSILAIENEISEKTAKELDPDSLVIDTKGLWVIPGLVDNHIHFNGAGGENGPQYRTPPLQLSNFIKAGITTAVAPLGTDGVSRSLKELLAKSRGLESEGITTYIYTGSYGLPTVCITESIVSDIVLIDKIIGTKIALSDHRSAHPSVQELRRLISDTRVGGILAGKAGLVMAHMGTENGGLNIISEALSNTNIPKSQVLPTHVNRNKELFEKTLKYCAEGGYGDITTSMMDKEESVSPVECIIMAMNKGIPLSSLTMSTDGNGSLPLFDDNGNMIGMGIGEPLTLLQATKKILECTGAPTSEVLALGTKNAARRLKLSQKGSIEIGMDADILIVSPSDFTLHYVIARGQLLMKEGIVVRRGTFETTG